MARRAPSAAHGHRGRRETASECVSVSQARAACGRCRCGAAAGSRRGGASPVLRNPNPTAPPTALRGAVYGVVNVGISIPPRGVFPPTMIRKWVGVTRPLGELGKMGGFGGKKLGGGADRAGRGGSDCGSSPPCREGTGLCSPGRRGPRRWGSGVRDDPVSGERTGRRPACGEQADRRRRRSACGENGVPSHVGGRAGRRRRSMDLLTGENSSRIV